MIITKDDENLIKDIFSKLNKNFVFDKSKLNFKIVNFIYQFYYYFRV